MGTAIAGSFIDNVAGTVWEAVAQPDPTPTISAQIDSIGRGFARDGRSRVLYEEVDLHGNGEKSYVMVFQDNAMSDYTATTKLRSDTLVIYDEQDGTLEQAFEFTPRWTDLLPFEFQLLAAGDLNGDSRPELVGAFAEKGMGEFFPTPHVIRWDDATQKYKIRGAIQEPPSVVKVKSPGSFAEGSWKQYARLRTIRDKGSNRKYEGYASEGFTVVISTNEPPVLVGAFVSRAEAHCCTELWQVVGWSLQFEGKNLRTYECVGYPRPMFVRDVPFEGDRLALRRTWLNLKPMC